jgi:hypothetical protein
VGSEVAVAHQGADAHATVRLVFDFAQRKTGDVDQQIELLDACAHEVDEVGAAGKKAGTRAAA